MVPKVSSHANSVSSHPVVNTRQLSEVGPLSKIPDGSYEKETISDELFQYSINKEHDVPPINNTVKQASNYSKNATRYASTAVPDDNLLVSSIDNPFTLEITSQPNMANSSFSIGASKMHENKTYTGKSAQ